MIGIYDGIIVTYHADAERRLWIKVLEIAIEDLLNGQHNQILRWVNTPGFGYICKAAGCSPHYARRRIIKLHELNNEQEAATSDRNDKGKTQQRGSDSATRDKRTRKVRRQDIGRMAKTARR